MKFDARDFLQVYFLFWPTRCSTAVVRSTTNSVGQFPCQPELVKFEFNLVENIIMDTSAKPINQESENGGINPRTKYDVAACRKELEKIKEITGWEEPKRSHMDDADIKWRFGGPPNYTLANLEWMKGKIKAHAPDSLEKIVEDLVKTWEFERTHKLDHTQHESVDQEKFQLSANGGPRFDNKAANQLGNYNVLLADAKKCLWNYEEETHESSHETFFNAFPAFVWEVLDVFSGPPTVHFTWRHFGRFTGKYKSHQGNGELLDFRGHGVAVVNEKLQLCDTQIFCDVNTFLEVMEGKKPVSALAPTTCPALSGFKEELSKE